jgi:hypothetical protein
MLELEIISHTITKSVRPPHPQKKKKNLSTPLLSAACSRSWLFVSPPAAPSLPRSPSLPPLSLALATALARRCGADAVARGVQIKTIHMTGTKYQKWWTKPDAEAYADMV